MTAPPDELSSDKRDDLRARDRVLRREHGAVWADLHYARREYLAAKELGWDEVCAMWKRVIPRMLDTRQQIETKINATRALLGDDPEHEAAASLEPAAGYRAHAQVLMQSLSVGDLPADLEEDFRRLLEDA